MTHVYWKFKGNKIGGIFRKMWKGEWTKAGSYATHQEAEQAVRSWRRLDYFRRSFDFSVGFIPS